MATSSKDIEALWQRYSDEGVKRGISVTQFFESNGVPYITIGLTNGIKIEHRKLSYHELLDFIQKIESLCLA